VDAQNANSGSDGQSSTSKGAICFLGNDSARFSRPSETPASPIGCPAGAPLGFAFLAVGDMSGGLQVM
jgi:hypothetical protein